MVALYARTREESNRLVGGAPQVRTRAPRSRSAALGARRPRRRSGGETYPGAGGSGSEVAAAVEAEEPNVDDPARSWSRTCHTSSRLPMKRSP